MKKTLFIVLMFAIVACTKKHEGNLAPVVIITVPEDGQDFTSGSAIAIRGTATDDAGLHEGTITVLKSDSKELFRWEPDVHNLRSFNIDYTFTPLFTVTTNLRIVATFYDHDDNKTEKVVNIKVKP